MVKGFSGLHLKEERYEAKKKKKKHIGKEDYRFTQKTVATN